MHFLFLVFAFLFGRLSDPLSCLCLASFLIISIAFLYNPTPSPSPLSFQLFHFILCFCHVTNRPPFPSALICLTFLSSSFYRFVTCLTHLRTTIFSCPAATRNKPSYRSSVQNRNCIVYKSPALTFLSTQRSDSSLSFPPLSQLFAESKLRVQKTNQSQVYLEDSRVRINCSISSQTSQDSQHAVLWYVRRATGSEADELLLRIERSGAFEYGAYAEIGRAHV